MNKFAVLNSMQRSVKSENYGANGSIKSWCLSVSHTFKGITRSRTISYITKVKGEYVISFTGEKFKSFMGALASLMMRFLCSLTSLITSMIFDDKSTNLETEINRATTSSIQVSDMLTTRINKAYNEFMCFPANFGTLKIDVAFLIVVNHLTDTESAELMALYGIADDRNSTINLSRAVEAIIK